MNPLLDAFAYLATPWPLFLVVLGVVAGVVVGAIPGLTGAMLITLTLPLTFSMHNPADAMTLLTAMYVGSISGGLISATLLRMPGTPASMVTALDGYPLAASGKPGRALGLGIASSFVGGVISWSLLATLARPIANWSTQLGPFDFFALTIMAFMLISAASGGAFLKGVFSGALGVLVSLPGAHPATGEIRLTFGIAELSDGLRLLPVLIGLFAIGQLIHEVVNLNRQPTTSHFSRQGIWLSRRDWLRHAVNMVRSSFIGAGVGILPGVGANIGSVAAYASAKGWSARPDLFGKGSEEGIVASEAANNATVGGALIPLVALGIPGSVIDAILLGALVIHGLQPGPLLFRENPQVVHTIIASALVANGVMIVFMLMSAGWLARIMQTPRHLLVPLVVVFCVVGSFAINNRMFDVWTTLACGVLGFALDQAKIPLAPFVIGFVLAPICEENLGAGLQASGGSWWPLLHSPFAVLCLVGGLAMAVWPMVSRRRVPSAAK